MSKRREQSELAVVYVTEIAEEVKVGLGRLVYMYEHGGEPKVVGAYKPVMPIMDWNGVREIFPDDIYRRIVSVAHRKRMKDFDHLRHHLKNYYTVICKFGNDVIDGTTTFEEEVARVDIDGTRMVLSILEQVKSLMADNARRHFWPH